MNSSVSSQRIIYVLLFAHEKNTKRCGAAVACYCTARGGFKDFLKARVKLVYFIAYLRGYGGIAFCMSDENAVIVDIGSVSELVGNVVQNHLVDVAAVFFARSHFAVDNGNQRLEL